jgi:hypothetical protein
LEYGVNVPSIEQFNGFEKPLKTVAHSFEWYVLKGSLTTLNSVKLAVLLLTF